MHDEDRLARGQQRKPCARARDLVDKTFAAGRPVAGGRFPEFAIGRAEFAFEFVVTPSGPRAKILFAKGGLFDRNETQPLGRLPRAARRTAHRQCASRQSCLERGKGCGIAEIGRRVGSVNHPARSVDRRVADQPEICLAHSWLRQPCGEQDKDRGLGHLLGAAEHVAGLAADLPQRQPRDGEPAQARQHRRVERVAP